MRLVSRASSIASCYFDLKTFHPASSDAMVDFCFAHTIKPLQVPEELKSLAAMVEQLRPNAVLEIGTAGAELCVCGANWRLQTPLSSVSICRAVHLDSYRHTEIIADHMQGWAGIGVLHL